LLHLDARRSPRRASAPTRPYTLIDGRFTYCSAKREWSLALQVTNLTNRLYYISKVNTGAAYLDGQIGMPREGELTLYKRF